MTATGRHREVAPYQRPRPPRAIPHLLVPEKRKISHWNDRHELPVGQDPHVAAIDFVELDPNRDVAEITTRTFGSAILTFLAALFLRLNEGWRGYDPAPVID